MPHSSNAAIISMIRSTADKAGIDWPDDLEAELEEAHTFQTSAVEAPDRQAVARAVRDAVTAGADPATDPAVVDALTRYQLAEVTPPGLLAEIATDTRREALDRHADTLYERLAGAVDRAGAVIAAARQLAPHIDPFNNEQPPALKPDAAKAWVQARDATLAIDQALKCWNLLTRATGRRTGGGGRYRDVLIVADLDAAQLDTILTTRPDFRDVIAAGYPLALATPEEHQDRAEKIQQQRGQQERAREQDYKAAARRVHGFTPAATP